MSGYDPTAAGDDGGYDPTQAGDADPTLEDAPYDPGAGAGDYDPTGAAAAEDEDDAYDPMAGTYDAEEQQRFQEEQEKFMTQQRQSQVLVNFRRELALGTMVEVHGLRGQRKFNGSQGTLIEQSNHTGRLEILITTPQGKKELALKQENVFRIPAKWTIDLCNLPPDIALDPDDKDNARELRRFHKYGPCKIKKSHRRGHLEVTYDHFDDAMDALEDVHKFVIDGERLDMEWTPLSRSQMDWRDLLNQARDDDLRRPELRYLEGELAYLNGEQCEVLDSVSDGTAQIEVKGEKLFVHERNLVPNDCALRQKWELETLRIRAAAAKEAREEKEEEEMEEEEKKAKEEEDKARAAKPAKRRRMWGMADYEKDETKQEERPLNQYSIRELKAELRKYQNIDWMALVEKKDLIQKLLEKRAEQHNAEAKEGDAAEAPTGDEPAVD